MNGGVAGPFGWRRGAGSLAVVLLAALALGFGCRRGADTAGGEPALGEPWDWMTAEEAKFDTNALNAFVDHVGGSGCIVRSGRLVRTWGYDRHPFDVASAVKPVYAHLVYMAIADGLIEDLDVPVAESHPGLRDLNPDLDYKDRGMTWRHLITQTACYGMREDPGTAFNYSDYQMALLVDALVYRVYESSYDDVDEDIMNPKLWGRLGCRDQPTFLGIDSYPGRLRISPRDFARFGWLYLNEGRWNEEQLVPQRLAVQAVSLPHGPTLQRTKQEPSEMLPGQRSIGAGPNHEAHLNSYSHTWWINGVMDDGARLFPEAPDDLYLTAGHGGKAALVVCPSLDMVVCWANGFRKKPIIRFYMDGRLRVRRAIGMLMASLPELRAEAETEEARGS